MVRKTVREIAAAWKEYKRPYVKKSTMAAYALILENHILPCLGDSESPDEDDVQGFVLQKLDGGLSVKTVKDIMIVLKMVMKFGARNGFADYRGWDIKYPATSPARNWRYFLPQTTGKSWTTSGTISHLQGSAFTSASAPGCASVKYVP